MVQFTATIRHNSISRAPVIECGADLDRAKRQAAAEFSGGFRFHEIVIYGQRDGCAPEIYATRFVGSRPQARWIDY